MIHLRLYCLQIPESPVWLVSKGKNEKAKKALCWLRGWEEPEIVKTEHLELIRYNEISGTRSRTADINHSNLLSKLAAFKDPSVYRPFILIMFYFLVSDIVSSVPWRPYTSKIMTEVGIVNNQSLLLVNIGTIWLYVDFYWYNNE